MLRCLAVVLMIALSGCASEHKLAVCHGPLVALNPSHFQPTPKDMATFNRMCPEVAS